THTCPHASHTLSLHDALPISLVRLVTMDDHTEGIDRIAVDHHVEPDQVIRPVLEELPVERCIAARTALQLVVEVEHDLGKRQVRSEEHTSELQSRENLVCRLL